MLADSTAIFEYLEETHPEPPLLPKSPALRAEARRLTAWFDDKFHNEVTANLVYERVNKKLAKSGYPESEKIKAGHAQHQVPPRLYRLADGPPALAGRRHADHRRLRGGGASLLPRLRERRRLDAQRRACTSGTPRSSRGRPSARSSPTWCRASPRRSTMRTSTSETRDGQELARRLKARAAGGGLRRLRHLRAGRDPRGGGAARGLRRGGLARADALDGRADGLARVAGGALAGGAVGDHAGRGLYAGGGSAGGAGAARPRGGQRLCPRARLSRPGQEAAEAARALAGGGDRGGDQGLRRHRAGDGEAAGAGGGDRLAGEAHQPPQPRELGNWFFLGAIFTDARAAAGRGRGGSLRVVPGLPRRLPDRGAAGALPARCAAVHQLPDDRARRAGGRRSCGRCWATASTAATTAWRSARGTSSRPTAREAGYAAREELDAPRLADLAALDDAGFRAMFSGSPIKRIGRNRFVRNVAYAIGNSGERGAAAGGAAAGGGRAIRWWRDAGAWAVARLS